MPEEKTALVLSGGGAKGAFTVGALQYMVGELGLDFDLVSGTSTGALIAPLVVTGEIDELERIYTTARTKDIVVRRRVSNILRSNSVYDVTPLTKLLKKEMTDERVENILASAKQMFLTAVGLQSGRITYFHTGPPAEGDDDYDLLPVLDGGTLKRAILASADMPALMPPVIIPKGVRPVLQYVDGGVKAYAPFTPAIDNGATDIYAVLLSPAPERREPVAADFNRLLEILIRTIDLLVSDVGDNDVKIADLYNRALVYLDAVKKKAVDDYGLTEAQVKDLFAAGQNPFSGKFVRNLHIIRPLKDLPAGTLDFDPPVMKRMVRMGRERAKEVLSG